MANEQRRQGALPGTWYLAPGSKPVSGDTVFYCAVLLPGTDSRFFTRAMTLEGQNAGQRIAPVRCFAGDVLFGRRDRNRSPSDTVFYWAAGRVASGAEKLSPDAPASHPLFRLPSRWNQEQRAATLSVELRCAEETAEELFDGVAAFGKSAPVVLSCIPSRDFCLVLVRGLFACQWSP